MKGIFDPTNSFWRWFARLCDIAGLSLCWVVCNLPVVTVGAATAALYDSVYHGVRLGESGDYVRFFRTFRECLRPGLVISLAGLGAAALFWGAWYVAWSVASGGNRLALLLLYAYRVALLAPLGVWLCAAFIQSRFSMGGLASLGASARLCMGKLPAAAAQALIVAALALFTYRHWFLPAIVTPALAALLCSFFTEPLFAPFMDK